MLTIALALMYDISLIDASKNQGTTKTQTVIDFLIHYIKVLVFVNLRNLLEKSLLGCFFFLKRKKEAYTQWLKITKNVAFEVFNFGISHKFLSH